MATVGTPNGSELEETNPAVLAYYAAEGYSIDGRTFTGDEGQATLAQYLADGDQAQPEQPPQQAAPVRQPRQPAQPAAPAVAPPGQ